VNFNTRTGFYNQQLKFTKINMVEPTAKNNYQSPHVEERFYKKPNPKFAIGEILRIEHIVKHADDYFEKEGIVAGWARTLR